MVSRLPKFVGVFLILGSGTIHLVLSPYAEGLGRLSLSAFGLLYIFTSVMILKERYFAGVLIPLAGLVTGLELFPLGPINIAFLFVEISVIVLSLYLGYHARPHNGNGAESDPIEPIFVV